VTGDDLNEFPENHYGCILADPAWGFATYSRCDAIPQRAEEQHYMPMTQQELLALPVGRLAAKDCLLFMWGIGTHIPAMLELGEAWGFEFVTDVFYWLKERLWDAGQIDMFTGDVPEPAISMGYWSRKQVEPVFLFKRGRPPRLSKGVRQVIVEPRREHSRKPTCQYERIEALAGGPYLEMFARTARPGWSAWGNQIEKFAEQ
jgi:N6-adenosine-specific RNA methylase IME4